VKEEKKEEEEEGKEEEEKKEEKKKREEMEEEEEEKHVHTHIAVGSSTASNVTLVPEDQCCNSIAIKLGIHNKFLDSPSL
jgi:ABC-type Zn2+ transport system substrate-binding protein/surface adhesin